MTVPPSPSGSGMSFVPRNLVSIQVGGYSANVYPKIDAMMPIFERLGGWGQTWIWDDLMVTGGTDWIAQAIADNSLVAVTDGSYIKEHYPELCSAAFVLECTKGRGRLAGAFADLRKWGCPLSSSATWSSRAAHQLLPKLLRGQTERIGLSL